MDGPFPEPLVSILQHPPRKWQEQSFAVLRSQSLKQLFGIFSQEIANPDGLQLMTRELFLILLGAELNRLCEKEDRARRKAEADAQLERETASASKLRGADKVAAKKTAAASSEHSDRARASAPALHARTIESAIAVLTIASGGGGSAGSVGGGGDDEHRDDGGGGSSSSAADNHAADVAAAAALTASMSPAGKMIKADDKHPEKRMKAAYKVGGGGCSYLGCWQHVRAAVSGGVVAPAASLLLMNGC